MSSVEYTDDERKRWLYRTADEMRAILDRIDARWPNRRQAVNKAEDKELQRNKEDNE